MSDALDDVVSAIVALLEDMAGINQAPEYPPEAINDPPMVVTYYVRHVPEYSLGHTRLLSTVHCDVVLPRSDLPTDEKAARPYVLLGLNAIAGSISLSDAASHCLVREILGPGDLPYPGGAYYGVRFVLEIKLTQAQLGLTVAA